MPIVPQEAFNFCGPTYQSVGYVIDAQRCVNLYPEPNGSGGKTRMALIGRPGLSPAPHWTLAGGPARALWSGNNRMFAVGGTHFYELGSAIGSIVTDFGAMSGTGLGPCQIIASSAPQLMVMDSNAAKVYFANPIGPALTPVFNGRALEYLDGFYVSIAFGASLATASPNQINTSTNGDGTIWDPLNYVIRSGSADLTTNLATLNGQLWIFGEKTIEVWYDAGNNGFPLQRIAGATINLGLLSPYSVVKFSNTIMWIAADDRGYAQVYMTQGLAPVRVSNPGVEQLIGAVGNFNYVTIFAYGYQENGHTFFVINFTDGARIPYQQLVYDLTTGLWHERYYAIEVPLCFASQTYFAGNNFVGMNSGKIYEQGILFPNDGTGNPINYSRTAPHVTNENRWIKYPRFELDGDFGTAAPTLSYSNDGGRNFLTGAPWPYPLRQAADAGSAGASRRFFALQLGRSRDRVFKMDISDSANLIRIANAYLTAEPGTEK
jgi:hypothetical protein